MIRTLWTLSAAFLLSTSRAWTSAADLPGVVGSTRSIVVHVGDDADLLWHLQPRADVARLTVEWSKLDRAGRPSANEYVHLYRDRREDLDMKIPAYMGRTELDTDALKDGDVLLKIRNVTLEDGATYRCFIPKLNRGAKEFTVQLVVLPRSENAWTTETALLPEDVTTPDPNNKTTVEGGRSHVFAILMPVVLVVCVALVTAAGLCGYFIRKQKCEKPRFASGRRLLHAALRDGASLPGLAASSVKQSRDLTLDV